ncbi:HtaA domain-containing protein [Glycomyces sp. NPDC047010]|uniref:HtaA domain-containing protein n=1 Tax=Glycomyces sp. NPDC047010 TaxID=3155023 RepID=UPI0033ECDB07
MPHATRRLTGALTAACALAAALLLWAAPAHADDLSGGRLDWGVKESFRSYITGPIAQGEIQTGDGASTSDGAYRFHSAAGTYEDGTAVVDYQGWVYFWGHDGELDLTFANPSVEYSGSSGTLYVYVNGTRTDMASLSGASLQASGGTVSVSGAAATLTANGANAFAGYYEAGQELDPVSFSADVAAEPEETEAPTESAGAEETGDAVTGAVVDWGVRTSWREYVSGDIAEGAWTVADGAADGGAVFRFAEGAGTATAADYSLAFQGTVAFTGTDVDLVLTDPMITATAGKGVLSAEVDGARVDLVSFEAELAEADGVLLAEDVPTVLTEAAVPVFGGFYQAGDPMDPLLIAVPLTADAVLPALPDLGSDPVEPATSSPETADADTASTETGMNPLVWIVPVAIAVLLGAGAAVVAVVQRRKRTTEDSPAAPPAGDTPDPIQDGPEGPDEDKEK